MRHASAAGGVCLLTIVFVGASVPLLVRAGPTWDIEQTLFYGERYAAYFRSGDARYLQFESDALEPREGALDVERSRREGGISPPHFVWPVGFTLAAFSNQLFSGCLQLLPPLAGYHAINLLLAGLVAVVGGFALAARAPLAGVAFVPIFWSCPAFFGNLMANLRDVPATCFLGLALFLLPRLLERGRGLLLAAVTLLAGLGLGCKITAAGGFLVAALVSLVSVLRGWRRPGVVLVAFLIAVVGAVATFVLLWPWLWSDGWSMLWMRLRLHVEDFLLRQVRPDAGWKLTPLLEVVATTPPVVLALFVAGLVELWIARRRLSIWCALLLAWLVVPLVRISAPGLGNYGGIRHFLEFWPAFAAVAALGVVAVHRGLVRLRCPSSLRVAAVAGVLLVPTATTLAASPFPCAYNNLLVGGNEGGRALGLSSSLDYWGSSLYPAYQDVAQQAARQGREVHVMAPSGQHLVRLAMEIAPSPWVRLAALPGSMDDAPTGEGVVLVLERRGLADHVRDAALYAYCRKELEPAAQFVRGGVALLRAYPATEEAGGLRGLRRRAAEWSAPRLRALRSELAISLRTEPADLEQLRLFMELVREEGIFWTFEEQVGEHVERALEQLPAEHATRYQRLWLAEAARLQASQEAWRAVLQRGAVLLGGKHP